MKKINSVAVVGICCAYVLFRLFLRSYWLTTNVINIYLDVISFMLPLVFLVLYLWPIQKNKETGILASLGCTLINFNIHESINVTKQTFESPTRELTVLDYAQIVPGILWMIFLLVLGFVLQRRGDFQYMRQVFLLFAILALMNILVALKFAFLKDTYFPFTTPASIDPSYDGSEFSGRDSFAIEYPDSTAPQAIDSVAPPAFNSVAPAIDSVALPLTDTGGD